MADSIFVTVRAVIDGDTFAAEVDAQQVGNQAKYRPSEHIRIANIDVAGLPSHPGRTDKERLERALLGKRLRCAVQARDANGRLVCRISRP